MTNLGESKIFLGTEILQGSNGVFICQKKYVAKVLSRFGMAESNAVRNPVVSGPRLHKDVDGEKVDATLFKQIMGSLMYLTATRPDIMFVFSLFSRYMSNPTHIHFATAKRILRYL